MNLKIVLAEKEALGIRETTKKFNMKVIIPMAGMGKRMRPHTLTVPKPLLKVAGIPIVQRIIEDLKCSTGKDIDEIAFVIGDFGRTVEEKLITIANDIGAKGSIYYQNEALGTAHAIYCANEALQGETLIAFADTLFIGNFEISDSDEAIIWTKEVENPENYGVVTVDEENNIKGFVEKPTNYVGNNAIIGIYYFKEGEKLRADIKALLDNEIKSGGEYQITDSLLNLKNNGMNFKCAVIDEWLDCGNITEFLRSNKIILEKKYRNGNKYKNVEDCKIIEPVFIGDNVKLSNAVIGPYVSIDNGTLIEGTKVENCIIGRDCKLKNSKIEASMIGNNVNIKDFDGILNVGDYNIVN